MKKASAPRPHTPTRNLQGIVFGTLIMLGGLAALVHQQFSYRVELHYSRVGPENVLFETRKVIHLPLWFSIPIIVLGAAVAILSARRA